MPRYQITFTRRDRLTIEIDAHNEDDAVDEAYGRLKDTKQFWISNEDIEFGDVEEVADFDYDYEQED